DGLARIVAALGDNDRALQTLERGFEERDPWMYFVHTDPVFVTLHSDPRFVELVRKIGIAPSDWQTRLPK
ncbi:MAG: TPR end-of-group domain-containing protein, partial [Thermoanaerobaculia bacterium]